MEVLIFIKVMLIKKSDSVNRVGKPGEEIHPCDQILRKPPRPDDEFDWPEPGTQTIEFS